MPVHVILVVGKTIVRIEAKHPGKPNKKYSPSGQASIVVEGS